MDRWPGGGQGVRWPNAFPTRENVVELLWKASPDEETRCPGRRAGRRRDRGARPV